MRGAIERNNTRRPLMQFERSFAARRDQWMKTILPAFETGRSHSAVGTEQLLSRKSSPTGIMK
jgi:hypothetical protein